MDKLFAHHSEAPQSFIPLTTQQGGLAPGLHLSPQVIKRKCIFSISFLNETQRLIHLQHINLLTLLPERIMTHIVENTICQEGIYFLLSHSASIYTPLLLLDWLVRVMLGELQKLSHREEEECGIPKLIPQKRGLHPC